MTEFRCSCHIDNKIYEFETLGAVILSHALTQFRAYIEAEGAEWEMVEGLALDKIDVE